MNAYYSNFINAYYCNYMNAAALFSPIDSYTT